MPFETSFDIGLRSTMADSATATGSAERHPTRTLRYCVLRPPSPHLTPR